MRFHMTLLTSYFPELDPPVDVYYQEVLEQVALAEELGWEAFWFTEHHFIPYGGLVPNPAVMLALAAGRTSRIRLGSAVALLPLHHPLQIAEDYAMVDVASGGRLNFGIGLGNTPYDYAVYGMPRDAGRARFEESAAIIARAWSDAPFSYEGTYWRFEDVTLYPRPVQRPHPPIWVAGASPASLGWAGRHGYNIMIVAHPRPAAEVRPGVAAWRQALVEAGHDLTTRHCKVHLRLWVDESSARAREVAEAALARYTRIGRLDATGRRGVAPPAADPDWEALRAAGRNVYGNPDEVIRGLQTSAREFGWDICGTQFNIGGIPHEAVKKAMRLFAREVMPAFR